MEFLTVLLISSIIFLGMSFIIVESTLQTRTNLSNKLDSKVFANYVLDDIETSIVKVFYFYFTWSLFGIDEISCKVLKI